MTVAQWLALVVFTAWRYNWRGHYVEPLKRADVELETRLWCFANGLDPERWYEWCESDYEALPAEAS
jgi:hypothetical protein